MSLKLEQKRLYESLPQDARCFVRVCVTDDALWASDLPRRVEDLDALGTALREKGFGCRMDEKTRLWHVDWTEKRWEEMLAPYPCGVPDFPGDERYHAAYALCRLWLGHPASRTPQNLPVIRRVLKLAAEPERKLLAAIPALHDQAAEQLRMGIPAAYDAGRILAKWLTERSNEK